MDWEKIVDKYYKGNAELKDILVRHSMSVAQKALRIVAAHPELGADRDFVYEASMLHDIGIFLTDAPDIDCHGEEPYIMHGVLGGKLIRSEGLGEEYARVAERHTGAGISDEDITNQSLPLPPGQYMPETLLERLVCYADKFYSKSGDMKRKSLDRVVASMKRISDSTLDRFMVLHTEFE